MTAVLRRHLQSLTGQLAGLKERVRAAVAGELGRAVGEAVRRLVHALAAGHTSPDPEPEARRRPTRLWADDHPDRDDDRWAEGRDAWADDPADGDDRDHHDEFQEPVPPPPSPPAAVGPAVLAGVAVARWWARRTGRWLAAAGWGLAVGLAGVLGGPVGRSAVAVLAAAADLLVGSPAPVPSNEF